MCCQCDVNIMWIDMLKYIYCIIWTIIQLRILSHYYVYGNPNFLFSNLPCKSQMRRGI